MHNAGVRQRTWPPWGSYARIARRPSVDLPHPLLPTRPTVVPASIVRFRPSKMRVLGRDG